MKSYPDAVRVRDENGELPLHIACQEAPLDVIEALVDAYPEGIKIENEFGEFPLSRAMNHPASLDAIKLLVNAFPECVQFTRIHGGLPIHEAFLYSDDTSMEFIKFLVDSDPEGVLVANDSGELPFHLACRQFISLDVLNFLVECHPRGIDQKDHFGRTPLEVIVFDPDETFAENKDYNEMLPLHHACKMGYSIHLIRSLIRVFPEGCLMKDESGLIPLHHVCRNDNLNKMDAINVLLNESPKSFAVADSNGEDQLQSIKIVASQRDERGMFLLHRLAACSKGNTNEDTLRLLFNANPDAIALPDNFLMLPVHHAVLNQASSLEMLMQLIKLNPENLFLAF